MSRGRSFLGQVTRYTGGGLRQEENTLTEAFAATLETAPTAAVHLANFLVQTDVGQLSTAFGEKHGDTGRAADFLAGLGTDADVKINTQWVIPTVGIPDLVLSTSNGPVTSRIAVEVKIDAELTNNQLERYVECGQFNAVVLLAPSEHLKEIGEKLAGLDSQYRHRVAFRAWESVGRELSGLAVGDPVQDWVIGQFIEYLGEEGLMAPEVLEEKHLEALTWSGPAQRALVELLHQVESSPLLKDWSPGENSNIKDKTGVGSYIHWLLPDWRRSSFSDGAQPWLQLSVISVTAESRPLAAETKAIGDGLFFTAGLCAANSALIDHFVDTMDAEREGLDSFEEGRDYRLGRIERAESLFGGKATLEDQATALAEWVRESFELVAPLQAAK